MTAITITKIKSGFVNIPAKFEVGDNDDGSSHLVSSAIYDLPDGYSVKRLVGSGDLAIFNAAGDHCELVEHSSGRPQIIDGSRHSPVLQKANQ